MRILANKLNGGRRGVLTMLVALALAVGLESAAKGQAQPAPQPAVPTSIVSFSNRAVGGVSIDARGVVSNVEVDRLDRAEALRLQAREELPGDLNQPAPLRKVSLRRLEAAIEKHLKDGTPVAEEILFLAGLQQIRYVFVFPEQNDIVLAGFGEGWRVDDHGNHVGLTTGHLVLHLDDLLVALRTAEGASRGGITCSIDPTQEGLDRLQAFLRQQGNQIGADPAATIAAIEESLGPQKITVTGVPETSHFARVLVAADYRMKRLAMNFDPSPVRGLSSYLQMASAKGTMMPRWWLEPDYDPLVKDAEGLTWEIRGSRVKAATEDDFLAANGERQHAGKASPIAQRWADSLTKHYDELALRLPIFAELHNIMDLAVVAALIAKESLAEKANCHLPVMLDARQLQVAEFEAPRLVDSKASFIKKGNNWVISASGGVLLNSWGIADRTVVDTQQTLAPVRSKASASEADRWWWN